MSADMLEVQGTVEETSVADVNTAEVATILHEYRRRQVVENLCGPACSLALHTLVLSAMFAFVVTRAPVKEASVEAEVKPEEVVEVDPKDVDPLVPPEMDYTLPKVDEEDLAGAPRSDLGDAGDPEQFQAQFPADIPQTENAENPEPLPTDVMTRPSPRTLPLPYGGRENAGTRGKKVKEGHGTRAGQVGVGKALQWLAMVQNDDGSWGNQSPAHTGLALLTFLAHGETPLSDDFGVTVQKAMQWMVDKEMSTPDGNMGQNGYGHGIATYALAESYGMTRIPFVRTAMERALEVLVKGQQAGGGYNYNYDQSPRWDTSVSGWQLQALKAGYIAGATNAGLEDAIRKSITFLRRMPTTSSGTARRAPAAT